MDVSKVPVGGHQCPAIRRTGLMERQPGSLRLDVGRPDHLASFVGLFGDELAEVGGRDDKRRASQVGKPCLDFGIGKARVDFLVELLDDLGRRGFRCADAEPETPLMELAPD